MVCFPLISLLKYSSQIRGESIIICTRKVSVEDILDTERRQEDCLLAATGWIWEKSQECWEGIAFQARTQRRKETRAFTEHGDQLTHTGANEAHSFPNEDIYNKFSLQTLIIHAKKLLNTLILQELSLSISLPYSISLSLLSCHSTCPPSCNHFSLTVWAWDTYLLGYKPAKKHHPLNSSNVSPLSAGQTFSSCYWGTLYIFEVYITFGLFSSSATVWFTVRSFIAGRANSPREVKRENLSHLYNSCILRPGGRLEQATQILATDRSLRLQS